LEKELTTKIESLTEYYKGDELAAKVLADKYLLEDENTPEDMWDRISHEIANVDSEIDDDYERVRQDFRSILQDFKFIPGGRIMYALGRKENVSLTNCYVIPIKEDSIEGIYDWLKESALTYRATGGVGTDISVLRPKGMEVKNSGGVSPGACSFMDLMSRSTHTVHQKLRRGALMITINVHHPDVLDFINIKKILGKVKFQEGEGEGHNDLYKLVEHANISVQITDEFLEALELEKNYEQRWPVDSEKPKFKKKTSAKKVWDAIIKNAHQHAEPGIFFIDNHRKNDALAYINPALTTNPCGEQFLGPYANCLLGHMNLARYVENGCFSREFQKDIAIAVRFLDNCIDWNEGKHGLPEQDEVAKNERRIGLGITGLGDALILMGIKYDSPEAIYFANNVMRELRDAAYATSVNLAEEKGPFPWFDQDKWLKSEFTKQWYLDVFDTPVPDKFVDAGIRNSFLLTCAPVGSGSIIAQVSSGIEPIFATSYTRRVREQDGDTFTEFKTFPRIIKDLYGDDNNLPEHVVTAYNIDHIARVELQAAIQKFIDNSISSTINLPEDTTEDVVSEIYLNAWKSGLKSITVYRENSREGIMIVDKEEEEAEVEEEKPQKKKKRPITVSGKTYKIPSGIGEKLYITVNPFPEDAKRPFEVLISSFSGTNPEIQTITVLLSALLKTVDSPTFIIDHLRRIESPEAPVFWHDQEAKKRHQINSVPRAVAIALEKFVDESNGNGTSKDERTNGHLEKCPKCKRNSWVNDNGCGHCIDDSCMYEKCGS
jgi:ribonucleoside-diphosphate reductase alpha chain